MKKHLFAVTVIDTRQAEAPAAECFDNPGDYLKHVVSNMRVPPGCIVEEITQTVIMISKNPTEPGLFD